MGLASHAVLAHQQAAVSFPVSGITPFAWWDPSDVSSVTTNSGNVSQLNDKSGNSRHLTQATPANQPPYATAALNGLNAVLINAAGQILLTTAGSITLPSPTTIFAVVKRTASGAGNQQIIAGTSNTYVVFTLSDAWSLYSGTTLAGSSSANTNRHQLSAVFNGGSSLLRVDGVQVATGTAGANTLSAQTISLGNSTLPANVFDGHIGEVVVVSGAVSGTPLTDTEAYLKSKWATV